MSSIMEEVKQREEKAEASFGWGLEARRMAGIVVGVAIYSVGMNLFLQPLHLYSGGFMGFSQLFNTLLHDGLHLRVRDLSGIFYYLLNIPFLIMAFRTMRRRFVVKSLITISLITLSLTLVPIPDSPVLEETIANCLIAGIMAGAGVGIMLRMGACDGGMDLIGMILIQKNGHFSVGKVNVAANIILYGICLLLFNIPTVIYSLIYSVICSSTCDRVHVQNITSQALIITKLKDTRPLEIEIMGRMHRGLTRWEAFGSYTGEDVTVLMAVISKYEVHQLKAIIHEVDPHAFVMISEGISVEGRFLKKIT